jgi:hypothetical protein
MQIHVGGEKKLEFHFTYLDNKEISCIFKDMLPNLQNIINFTILSFSIQIINHALKI